MKTASSRDARACGRRMCPAGGTHTVSNVRRTTGKTVGKVVDATCGVARTNVVIATHTRPGCGGGTHFSEEGDARFFIVDEQRKVVALVFGGSSSGTGRGSHFHPGLDLLVITLVSTAHPIARTGGGGLRELTASADGEDPARAAILPGAIVACERGHAHRDLVDRYRGEVMTAVKQARPVKTAWHRARGTDYRANGVHTSRHAEHRVPRATDGVDREGACAGLNDALARPASAALRVDLERHADELRRLVVESDGLDDLDERVPAALAGAP